MCLYYLRHDLHLKCWLVQAYLQIVFNGGFLLNAFFLFSEKQKDVSIVELMSTGNIHIEL